MIYREMQNKSATTCTSGHTAATLRRQRTAARSALDL